MINWMAMQVVPNKAARGEQATFTRPGDANISGLTMGSWRADRSKGGAYRPKAASTKGSKGGGKAKVKAKPAPPGVRYAPWGGDHGGWTTETLSRATRS